MTVNLRKSHPRSVKSSGRWLAAVQEFAAEHGHTRMIVHQVSSDGQRVGSWVRRIRAAYSDGTLDPHLVGALEQIPGWEWEDDYRTRISARFAARRAGIARQLGYVSWEDLIVQTQGDPASVVALRCGITKPMVTKWRKVVLGEASVNGRRRTAAAGVPEAERRLIRWEAPPPRAAVDSRAPEPGWIAELRTGQGMWALVEEDVTGSRTASLRTRYPEIEFTHRNIGGRSRLYARAVADPATVVAHPVDDDGRLICLVCAKPFASLASHLRTHELDAADYREKFCLPERIPLTSESVRHARSTRARVSGARPPAGNRGKRLNMTSAAPYLAAIREYGQDHDPNTMPRRYRDAAGTPIGEWTARRRADHQKGCLPADVTAALEAVPGWHWA